MPPLNTLSRSVLTVAISQALLSNPTQAATITVNNSGDGDIGCTLREAIESMVAGNVGSTGCTNSSIDGFGTNNTIDFSVTGTLNLTQAEELSVVNISLEIKGPGQDNLTINGNNNARVINIADADVTIDGVTISGGSTNRSGGGVYAGYYSSVSLVNSTVSGNFANNGGGVTVENGGVVSLVNSTVSENSASRGGGGVSANDNSSISLSNTNVNGNTASNYGGGIFTENGSSVSLVNSTVSDNLQSSTNGTGGGISARDASSLALTNSTVIGNSSSNGGGLFAFDNTVVTLTESTVSDNSADSDGGGLFVISFEENGIVNVALLNSTISGNSADRNGGGILADLKSSVNLTNSTVTQNTANRVGGGIMFQRGSNGNLTNSLVSGNKAVNAGSEITNSASTINADDNNLFGDDESTNAEAFDGFTPGLADITATSDGSTPTPLDQILLPLNDNGGNTQTHAIGPESPARDAGGLANCPMNDQRGQLRDDGDGACDIGAIEFNLDDIPEEKDDNFIVIPLKNGKVVVVPN